MTIDSNLIGLIIRPRFIPIQRRKPQHGPIFTASDVCRSESKPPFSLFPMGSLLIFLTVLCAGPLVPLAWACDLTCLNQSSSLRSTYVRCPMCVCDSQCGIHLSGKLYDCYSQASCPYLAMPFTSSNRSSSTHRWQMGLQDVEHK
jgi:hypothetical protein